MLKKIMRTIFKNRIIWTPAQFEFNQNIIRYLMLDNLGHSRQNNWNKDKHKEFIFSIVIINWMNMTLIKLWIGCIQLSQQPFPYDTIQNQIIVYCHKRSISFKQVWVVTKAKSGTDKDLFFVIATITIKIGMLHLLNGVDTIL